MRGCSVFYLLPNSYPSPIYTVLKLLLPLLLTWIVFDGLAAQPWLCPWVYRQGFAVTENSGTALTDYQVKLTVAHQIGMKADFSDLRFTSTDGATPLDYWVEYKIDDTLAHVWVELDSLPASAATTFYYYYGKPDAINASNGTNTFVFFDDMDDVLNTWNLLPNTNAASIVQATYQGATVFGKRNDCDPKGGWQSIGTTLDEFRLIAREARVDNGPTGCAINRYGVETSGYNGYGIRRSADQADTAPKAFGTEIRNNQSGGSTSNVNVPQPRGTFLRTEMTRCAGGNIVATAWDDAMNLLGSNARIENTHTGGFDRVCIRGGRDYNVDYMAVGRMTCNEPTVGAPGAVEEKCPEIALVSKTDDTCQAAQGAVTVQLTDGFPPYTVEWTPGVGSVPSGQTVAAEGGTATIPGILGNSTLTITVKDQCFQ